MNKKQIIQKIELVGYYPDVQHLSRSSFGSQILINLIRNRWRNLPINFLKCYLKECRVQKRESTIYNKRIDKYKKLLAKRGIKTTEYNI